MALDVFGYLGCVGNGTGAFFTGMNANPVVRLVHRRTVVRPVALGVLLVAIAGGACIGAHGGPTLTVRNQLGEPIAVYEQGLFVADIAADGSFDYPIFKFDSRTRYEARNRDGAVLAARCFDWTELQQQSWRIVFDSSIPSPGSAGACT